MATGVAVLRTRTWDTLSNLHSGRPDVLSARTRAKLGNTSTSPLARFQPSEGRARTGGTTGTEPSTFTNGRHTARICWARGPSQTREVQERSFCDRLHTLYVLPEILPRHIKGHQQAVRDGSKSG